MPLFRDSEMADQVAGLVEAVAGLQEDRQEWLGQVLRRRVLVHQDTGLTHEGSLTAVMVDGLVLRAASLVNDDGSKTPLAGEVWIPRARVAFAQLDE